MRRKYLIIMSVLFATSMIFANKIVVKGKINILSIRTITIVPVNIDDYVQASINGSTVSVEFIKQFRKPITISIVNDNGDIVCVRGGLVNPQIEQISLNNCENGQYTIYIEDYNGTFLYGYFELE